MSGKPTYEELEARVAELEPLLQQRTLELTQRIRELKAVLEISTASDQASLRFTDFYRSVLGIIAASFHYPEIACVELKVGEEVYRTANFRDTSWKIGRGLLDGHQMIGRLTVGYVEERPESDFGPFSKEEKNLLIVVSRYLTQIIKRKQSEEQLERFRRVISQSFSMIVMTDRQGRVAYVNERLTETLGYSPEELIGQFFIFTPDDPKGKEVQKNIETTLLQKGHYYGELEILTRDRKRLWVRASVTPVIKDGEVEYFVGMFDDITEELALREENREKQARLDAIMGNIPLSITLTDENGRFTFVNRQAELNLRLSNEMILSKSLTDLFPREGGKGLRDIRKVFRTKKPSFGEYRYNIHGKETYFEIQRVPLLDGDGRVTQVMSISANTTRRKYEHKVLKIQQTIDSLQSIGETFEESLRVLFDNLFELDWIDGGGIYIVDYEQQMLRLVYHRGLSKRFVRGVDRFPFDSPNAQVVMSSQARYARPMEFLDPSRDIQNDEKISFIAVLPLVYHNNVVGSINLASRTVSGIDDFNRQAIETIAQKIANLMDVINTREQLTRANEELMKNLQELREKQELLIQKSKLESLGEMSAGLAHEISQPLSVISLAFENILYKLQENQALSEYFTRKSATINLNIDKIRQLIDHIRVFSRDQSSVMFEKVDANQAIRNTLALTSVQLSRHHILVRHDLDERGCQVLGNLTKMEQVIMNLLSNARDAVDEREKNFRGKVFMKKISLTTRCDAKNVIIIIEDNGGGIRPEHRDKLFNPFFTTKPPGQGTGLGLSIIYGIITEMKGTIDIQSKLNKFTRIIITLPKI